MQEGVLREEQVLGGLPHPAGANAERIAYFLGNKPKEALSVKNKAESPDKAKAEILCDLELNQL